MMRRSSRRPRGHRACSTLGAELRRGSSRHSFYRNFPAGAICVNNGQARRPSAASIVAESERTGRAAGSSTRAACRRGSLIHSVGTRHAAILSVRASSGKRGSRQDFPCLEVTESIPGHSSGIQGYGPGLAVSEVYLMPSMSVPRCTVPVLPGFESDGGAACTESAPRGHLPGQGITSDRCRGCS